MRSLKIVWVGRRPGPEVDALAADYAQRLARLATYQEVRVRPAAGRDGDPGRALSLEAEALGRLVDTDDRLVALDERGREFTTEEFARWLHGFGNRRITFVLGSDLGLDEAVRLKACERLSLSRLTLPHQLARVVLLEQLYRACDLLAGGRYHREGTVHRRV